jgi:hypothetical protein
MNEFTLYLNDTEIHQFRGWLDEYVNSVPDNIRITPSKKKEVSNLVDWQPWRDSLKATIHYSNTDGSGFITVSERLITTEDGTEVLEGAGISTRYEFTLMEFYFRQVGKRLKVEIGNITFSDDFERYIKKFIYQLYVDWPDAAELSNNQSVVKQDIAISENIIESKDALVENRYLFKKIGDYWSLKFDDEEALIKNTKGMVQLHRLISYPDMQCGVEELYEMVNKVENPLGVPKGNIGMDDFEDLSNSSFSKYRNIDKRAWNEYKETLQYLSDERIRVESIGGDTSEIDRHTNLICEQLTGGEMTNPREKARLAVKKSIETALKNIREDMPLLGKHLADRIKTGFECQYVGDKSLHWITN